MKGSWFLLYGHMQDCRSTQQVPARTHAAVLLPAVPRRRHVGVWIVESLRPEALQAVMREDSRCQAL